MGIKRGLNPVFFYNTRLSNFNNQKGAWEVAHITGLRSCTYLHMSSSKLRPTSYIRIYHLISCYIICYIICSIICSIICYINIICYFICFVIYLISCYIRCICYIISYIIFRGLTFINISSNHLHLRAVFFGRRSRPYGASHAIGAFRMWDG